MKKTLLFLIFIACSVRLLAISLPVLLTATSGTPNGNYFTLGEAFTAINSGTHKGAITIKLSGIINETSTATLNASGSGAASYTSVNIYPTASGVIIYGSLYYLIHLNGADNVTIDGRVNAAGNSKNLVIENRRASSIAVNITGGACNNTLKYTVVKGSSTPYNGIIDIRASDETTANNNNTFDYCDFTNYGGNRSISVIYSMGFSSTCLNSDSKITNCNFYDFISLSSGSGCKAIFLQGKNNNWTIENNSIYETAGSIIPSAEGEFRVISIQADAGTSFTIRNNYIGGSQPQCGGTALIKTGGSGFSNKFRALYLNSGNFIVKGNKISKIDWTDANTTGTYPYGIDFETTSASTIQCDSNIIGSDAGTNDIKFTGNCDYTFYGIYMPQSTAASASYNKIGAVTLANNGTNYSNFYGIYGSINGTVSGNLIGSLTTENSIYSAPSVNAQSMCAISNTVTGTSNPLTNNTVMNLTNASPSSGASITGLNAASGTNKISNNVISNLKCSSSSSGNAVTGINLSASTNGHEISGNTVSGLSDDNLSFSGRMTGIYAITSLSGTSSCSSNNVYDISAVSPNAIIYGIYNEPGGWQNLNNMVSLGSGISAGNTLYGIYSGASAFNCYFNTVRITGTVTSGTTNPTYSFYDRQSSTTRIYKNNLFINERSGGTTGTHYGVYLGGTSNLTIDNNNYYAPNGAAGYLSNAKTTLADFRTATGQDANSVSQAVTFTSSTDLHLSGGSIGDLQLTGIPVSGITTDFDSNTRSSSFPYMGADENTSVYLPVELESFSASVSGNSVTLNWKTATELNNYGFEIERAILISESPVMNYEKAGFTAGAGNSNSVKAYSFIDKDVKSGRYQYRLKQIDNDGQYKYTGAVTTVVNTIPDEFSLYQNYPNPFNPSTVIRYQLPETAQVTLKVYDMLGKEVATLVNEKHDAGIYNAVFNAPHLSSGIYIAKLSAGSFIKSVKMQLIK